MERKEAVPKFKMMDKNRHGNRFEPKSLAVSAKIILLAAIILTTAAAVFVIYEIWKAITPVKHGAELLKHTLEDLNYHKNLVNRVNSANSMWKAVYNPFASRSQLDELLKVPQSSGHTSLSKEILYGDTEEHLKELMTINITIPQNFDARVEWPLCWSVHQVPNQAGCGSCWATSAASVISDRICVATNAVKQVQVSSQDLVSCCLECGGCHGSKWALAPFTYWKHTGLVSGGSHGSFEGCKPYMLPPDCGSPCSTNYYRRDATPSCEKQCQPLYRKSYDSDLIKGWKNIFEEMSYENFCGVGVSTKIGVLIKYFDSPVFGSKSDYPGSKAYWIRGSADLAVEVKILHTATRTVGSDELLKREILLHGPMQGCFTVKEDFQHYNSGIYQASNNSKYLYGHCAKLIGWGVTDGVEYWTYMNTWGRNWGENGFFRVMRQHMPEEAVACLL